MEGGTEINEIRKKINRCSGTGDGKLNGVL